MCGGGGIRIKMFVKNIKKLAPPPPVDMFQLGCCVVIVSMQASHPSLRNEQPIDKPTKLYALMSLCSVSVGVGFFVMPSSC